MTSAPRELLATRLGFLLLSAGCAIGLGNVWRFPYIAGLYGGAIFVVIYLLFLFAMGLPIVVMEFAMGRASRRNMGLAFHVLEPKGSKWHRLGWLSLAGGYFLMMFYIPVAGWMLAYCYHTATGALTMPPDQVSAFFGNMLADPYGMMFWTLVVAIAGFGVCALGVRAGVERVVKFMMIGLLAIMVLLAIHSIMLPGASEGLNFYLAPDWERASKAGWLNLLNAAMNQAFFTLSIGVGAMMVFGSYLDRKHTLTQETALIVGLDTFVALTAGLIIFPACFAFNVQPDSGPGLVFITLPNIFNAMSGGRIWGSLFFVFMSCAALTTVIAVVENIICYCMDVWRWSRRKAVLINSVLLTLLTLPCVLGFNLWSDVTPFGAGSNIMDLEDFIISNNLLPLGSLFILLFCCHRYGWGWDKFKAEADQGRGMHFPRVMRFYLTWILPLVVVFVFLQGYIQKFF